MKLMDKLEKRLRWIAIPNLPLIMIGLYVLGYTLSVVSPGVLSYLTLDPYYILHGQIWRLVSWVVIPPDSLSIFTVIMLMFYYSLANTLERTWGSFRFTLYMLTGVLCTVIGAFILYGVLGIMGRWVVFGWAGTLFSTYYINMSIFLAFAFCYPDMTVLLYMIIPIKIKWLAMLYGVLIAYDFVRTNWIGRVVILASLMNFFLFLLLNRGDMSRLKKVKKVTRPGRAASPAGPAADPTRPMHRCTVCGRTEKDGDDLTFRYCSKCAGAHEYCQQHLFNHSHIIS
ncbi:MAG: hypothetical protein Q4B59_03550 [Lachnospiraceae bacterium]|nr:hypothetical protein [Lachnospiraceae bacterium]